MTRPYGPRGPLNVPLLNLSASHQLLPVLPILGLAPAGNTEMFSRLKRELVYKVVPIK
jgi:hypothetical protein